MKILNIGMIGLGNVGSGIWRVLEKKKSEIKAFPWDILEIKKIGVRDIKKERQVKVPPELLTQDVDSIINSPDIDIIIEVAGGKEEGFKIISKAINAGKHIVTANKDVIASYGTELFRLAKEKNVRIYFEASVGAGIPIIRVLREDLVANSIQELRAILNGTSNYILTRMSDAGEDFESALATAQRLGYAEPNPANDIKGIDAAYKLTILASIAFNAYVAPSDIYVEGIDKVTSRDIEYAHELGYEIKSLAIARRHSDGLELRVHPTMIPRTSMLAAIRGVYNGIYLVGDAVGPMMFYGRGAGSLPTASAVVSDLCDLARSLRDGANTQYESLLLARASIKPMEKLETRYYIRLNVPDRPGVLAGIAKVFGELGISIASVVQKEVPDTRGQAELVIITHTAQEGPFSQAILQMEKLDVVNKVESTMRIEGVVEE
jgi:homoserine dehydrogenase